MSNLTGRWPFFYPNVGSALVPFEDNFLLLAQSVRDSLEGYDLPLGVDGVSQRNALFPSPANGDRAFRRDLLQEEVYSSGSWSFLSGKEEIATMGYSGIFQDHPDYGGIRLTRQGKRVQLKGAFSTNSTATLNGSSSYTIGTIPPGWRPQAGGLPFDAIVFSGQSNGISSGWARVETGGAVQVSPQQNVVSTGVNGMVASIDLTWFIA